MNSYDKPTTHRNVQNRSYLSFFINHLLNKQQQHPITANPITVNPKNIGQSGTIEIGIQSGYPNEPYCPFNTAYVDFYLSSNLENILQTVSLTLGPEVKVILTSELVGQITIVAYCYETNALIGSTTIEVTADADADIIDQPSPPSPSPSPSSSPTLNPRPLPSYIPCYNPCYNPYRPICNIPHPRRESCNIPPRPRCRIRESENYESSDVQMYYNLYLDQQAEAIEQFERENEQQLIKQAVAETNAKNEA